MNKVHFSSATNEWGTPREFFDTLDAEFGFTLDAAANSTNAKCANYLSQSDDSLSCEWAGTVWLNPPYGRGIGQWIKKAWETACGGSTVVVLMPVRSDTPYWHDYVMRASEVRLVRGRLRFDGGLHTNRDSHNAPFPCAVVVFKPFCDGPPTFRTWER